MVLCGVAIGIIKDRFTIPGEFVESKDARSNCERKNKCPTIAW